MGERGTRVWHGSKVHHPCLSLVSCLLFDSHVLHEYAMVAVVLSVSMPTERQAVCARSFLKLPREKLHLLLALLSCMLITYQNSIT